eukprot:scaffold5450_cov103-Skeletonema_dohrnii-CCMP3373.AAC.3
MDLFTSSELVSKIKWCEERKDLDCMRRLCICGPEYDAMGAEGGDYDIYDETETVPEIHINIFLKHISTLPALREVEFIPDYYSVDGGMLESSRVCWLLSKDSKIETLTIGDLMVKNQSDVEKLAEAFSVCTSIKALHIQPLIIGYRDVKTVAPLMKALAAMPNLKKLHICFDAFGEKKATQRYLKESAPILQAATNLQGVEVLERSHAQHYPALSNGRTF